MADRLDHFLHRSGPLPLRACTHVVAQTQTGLGELEFRELRSVPMCSNEVIKESLLRSGYQINYPGARTKIRGGLIILRGNGNLITMSLRQRDDGEWEIAPDNRTERIEPSFFNRLAETVVGSKPKTYVLSRG